jgi:predicted Ser/Thr protein kinase
MIGLNTKKTFDAAISDLYDNIRERKTGAPVSFNEFMKYAAEKPSYVFRNIFQMFHDMIYSYVGDGYDEYPDDPESIDYVNYDCSKLFEEGVDHPFFADRLFTNRLINHVASFKRGIQQNRIYIFEGPHGSGKSTFLNNFLMKFEQYTKSEQGAAYETVWRLNKEELGALTEHEADAILGQLRNLVDRKSSLGANSKRDKILNLPKNEILEIPCPSHDNPLLLIPKRYRKELLDDLIQDKEFKERLFNDKQYEWVFKNNPCTICTSLYQTFLGMLDSPSKVFDMVFARRYQFNRRLGEGISVFNPGDKSTKSNVITNQLLQKQLNGLLKDSNKVRYIFSRYAKTNNGIYALMDVKAHNKERFANLHGIISEGVHKVEDIEENVNSLFLALMNPEDQVNITDTQSFSDRIIYIKIPYVLDYNTEAKIYKNIFGDQIENNFLPRVLQNFAKVIISSRLQLKSESLLEWIDRPEKYASYCDNNLQLLKMDIYAGHIPTWLSDEDRKKFTAKRRKSIIAESELEGNNGFSGRDSIKIFNEFYSTYAKKDKLITMGMICKFFKKHSRHLANSLPDKFLNSLVNFYNYTVLQEVKESLYYYNEDRISRDVQNYLFAVNFESDTVKECVYTGEMLVISEDYFTDFEKRLIGSFSITSQRLSFRRDIQKQYASKALTQEMLVGGKSICETEVYALLYERYVHSLKEKVMDPFLKNDNFRRAIKDYASEAFKTYDKRIRDELVFLMNNLKNKYGYTEQGAQEVCIYVVDNDLAKTFAAK